MKNLLTVLFLTILPYFGYSQNIDSISLQLDSLLETSVDLALKYEYDSAFEKIEIAKELIAKSNLDQTLLDANLKQRNGEIFMMMGKIREAEPFFAQALNIWEKETDKNELAFGRLINRYGTLLAQLGRFAEAEPLYKEALQIFEKAEGKEERNYIDAQNNLAILYFYTGRPELAKPLWEKVTFEWKKQFGEFSYKHALGLGNLSNLYFSLGQIEKAEALYMKTIDIQEQVLEDNLHTLGVNYLNLGSLYLSINQFEKAERFQMKALKIFETTIGENHINYLETLADVAKLPSKMGNSEKALKKTLGVIERKKNIIGTEHISYAASCYTVAVIYATLEEFALSESFFIEAREIYKNVPGEGSVEYIGCFSGLATLYMDMGKLEEAKENYLYVIDALEKEDNRNNADYINSLTHLGMILWEEKQYDRALSYLQKAKQILENEFRNNLKDYAWVLHNMGIIYTSKDENQLAESAFLEANKIEKQILIRASKFFSERELSSYIKVFSEYQEQYLEYGYANENYSKTVYDDILFYKGFLLNGVNQISALAHSDSITKEKYLLLKSYNRLLANEYTNPDADSLYIEELEEKSNVIEKELINAVAGLGLALQQVTWQEVQQQLQPTEATIEFIHYPTTSEELNYAALILRPNTEQPQFIPLFKEKQLENSLTKQNNLATFINSIYKGEDKATALSQLIYEPLKEALQGVKTIYYSPSGQLHRLNLAAVEIEENTTMGDRFQMIQLSSTRQLVAKESENKSKNKRAILYGGIEYESEKITTELASETEKAQTAEFATDNTIIAASESTTLTRNIPNDINFSAIDSTLRGGKWDYLKWTKVEIEAIELIIEDTGMNITTKIGQQATEESFKKLGANTPSPQIIHLATHGFFFPDPESSVNSNLELVPTHRKSGGDNNEPIFKVSDHPMIRSGLVLVNGNHAWKTGKPIAEGREDGILTAYEISQMNLSNTELVVLSACETGLGDIQGNEGVYGLQRAFKIAGAKYLIMSLWQIPDFQTQELMTEFYVNWLEEKMDIPTAFRAAQAALKKRYPDPFLWAGFVLVE